MKNRFATFLCFYKRESRMNNKTCYIVGAGDNYGLDFVVAEGDLVIAADGGLTYLREQGITADLIIGDFDSLPQKPKAPNVVCLSDMKDDTDALAAVREGAGRGYKTFCIYCGTGGRVEHTLANIQTLAYLSQNGMRGCLVDRDAVITTVTNGGVSFSERCKGYVSVFSFSDKALGVTLTGLKYELVNVDLTSSFPIGVSNEFIGAIGRIIVNDGTLAVVFPREHIKDIYHIV